MKAKVLKMLGVCATALAFAMPASAFTVNLSTVGQSLQVGVSGISGETITAYDLFITYAPSLFGNITGVVSNNQLGDTGLFEAIFIATSVAGTVEGDEVSLLTNAQVNALQTGAAFTLFTVQFDALADLSTANFALGFSASGAPSTMGCANGVDGTVRCFSNAPTPIPEPMSLALVVLGLAGAGVTSRRRVAS